MPCQTQKIASFSCFASVHEILTRNMGSNCPSTPIKIRLSKDQTPHTQNRPERIWRIHFADSPNANAVVPHACHTAVGTLHSLRFRTKHFGSWRVLWRKITEGNKVQLFIAANWAGKPRDISLENKFGKLWDFESQRDRPLSPQRNMAAMFPTETLKILSSYHGKSLWQSANVADEVYLATLPRVHQRLPKWACLMYLVGSGTDVPRSFPPALDVATWLHQPNQPTGKR